MVKILDKINVLVDMFETRHGYAGIATDLRTTYVALSEIQNINLSGLLYSGSNLGISSAKLRKMLYYKPEILFSKIIHEIFLNDFQPDVLYKIINKLKGKKKIFIGNIIEHLLILSKINNNYKINSVKPDYYNDVIWRKLLHQTVDINEFEINVIRNFYVSDIQREKACISLSKFGRKHKLDIGNNDIAITFNITPIKFNKKHISRVHDLIPIVQPDVVYAEDIDKFVLHLEHTIHNANKIVCVSKSAAKDLSYFYPQIENKIEVIPCMLTDGYFPDKNQKKLKLILKNRLSDFNKKNAKKENIEKYSSSTFDYFIYHGTIEGRKNVQYICKAFNEFLYKNAQINNFKLIISGKFGWLYEDSKQIMKNLIKQDKLIHLESVTTDEMRVLLSHAKAHIFPSYYEGFGLPPLEALQCRCPVITSHISSMPEVLGDGALYCNPYDVKSLVDKMELITKNDDVRNSIINIGYKRTELYKKEKILPMWENLINRTKNNL